MVSFSPPHDGGGGRGGGRKNPKLTVGSSSSAGASTSGHETDSKNTKAPITSPTTTTSGRGPKLAGYLNSAT